MDLSNTNVIHQKKNGIEFLQFRRLLKFKNLNHAYSLGLDVNYRTARANKQLLSRTEYEVAEKSYRNLCKSINANYNDIVKTNQEHTDKVKIVQKKFYSNKPDFNLAYYANTDGLVTNKKDILLSTTNADCILLLFFDPIKNVIANIHSGWKGTLQRISVKTVLKMVQEFGCRPSDIICCICPSIRKCHFEVDRDVKDMFFIEFQNLKEISDIIEPNTSNTKWYIDTVLINKIILMEAGLKPQNIIDSGICSVCNSNIIHSYRVEKKGYGLETAVIQIRERR